MTLSWDNCLKMKLLVIISATPLLLSTLTGAQHNNFDPIPTNVARQHFNVDQSKLFVSQIPLRDVMEWCHNTNQYCFINRDRDHWHLDNLWYLYPYNSKQDRGNSLICLYLATQLLWHQLEQYPCMRVLFSCFSRCFKNIWALVTPHFLVFRVCR